MEQKKIYFGLIRLGFFLQEGQKTLSPSSLILDEHFPQPSYVQPFLVSNFANSTLTTKEDPLLDNTQGTKSDKSIYSHLKKNNNCYIFLNQQQLLYNTTVHTISCEETSEISIQLFDCKPFPEATCVDERGTCSPNFPERGVSIFFALMKQKTQLTCH